MSSRLVDIITAADPAECNRSLDEVARSLSVADLLAECAALERLRHRSDNYEVPNLLRNGTLRRLLDDNPRLDTLLLHNIDTLGADVDPELLALHRASGATLSFEVISRRLEDRGGGLARVDGRPRLVEGLAIPREEDKFGHIRVVNTALGLFVPALVTPLELFGGSDEEDEAQ